VFMDVDNIEPGLDFVEILGERVGDCEVLLADIGKDWATCRDANGHRRLDDPHDFVRIEIEAALGRNVRVIPTLVDGAAMPRADDLPEGLRPLTRRQAVEISHTRFDMDAERLLRALARIEVARKDREAEEAAQRVSTEKLLAPEVRAERIALEEKRRRGAEAAVNEAEERRRRVEAAAENVAIEAERRKREAEPRIVNASRRPKRFGARPRWTTWRDGSLTAGDCRRLTRNTMTFKITFCPRRMKTAELQRSLLKHRNCRAAPPRQVVRAHPIEGIYRAKVPKGWPGTGTGKATR